MSSDAYLEAERKSRLETRTASSNGGHYDLVVAVSQSMVNAAFADMYQKHQLLREIHRKLSEGNEVHGELHPTEILIKAGMAGANMNKVYWMIHLKSGWLRMNVMGSEATIDLTDWRLAVEVEFSTQSVTFVDADTPEQTQEKEIQLKNLEGRYSWKADRYDPSFLYANLTSGLGHGFSWDYSTFGNDERGVPIQHDNLISRLSTNPAGTLLFGQLNTFLIFWANDLHKRGLTVVATQFKAPASPQDVRATSFPVNDMVLQTTPYILEVKGEAGCPEGAVSLDDPGSRNCICYCELTSRNPLSPSQRVYPYSGNFATIGKGKDDATRIDGTFALSRNLFFEEFLLKIGNLHNFARASIISPRPAVFTSDKKDVNSSWSREYGVHYKNDDVVQFKTNVKEGDRTGIPAEYSFTQPAIKVASGTAAYRNELTKRYFYHEAQATSTMSVRWIPGSNDVIVKGLVEYSYIQTGGTKSAIGANGELEGADSILKEWFNADWTFTISITGVENRELQMTISKALIVTVQRDDSKSKIESFKVPEDQGNKIQSELKTSLSAQLDGLEEALKKALKSELKFLYPGTGTFKFAEEALFNNNGDILIAITYANAPNGLIVLPDPYEILNPVRPIPTSGKDTGTSQPHPETTLTWDMTKTAQAIKTKQPITITARNDTKEPVYMKALDLSLFVSTDPKPPTNGTNFLTTSPLFIKGTDLTQSVAHGTNLVCIREDPAGALELLPLEIGTFKRSALLTKCTFSIKPKNELITFPAGASVAVEFLLETGRAGRGDVMVEEKEVMEDGKAAIFEGPRGGTLQVTLIL